jgi:hypothetical protein
MVDLIPALIWPFVALAGSALLYLFILFRVSAFRKDHQGLKQYFGNPLKGFPFISMAEILTANAYTERGKRILPWLYVSILLLAITGFILFLAVTDRL